VLNKPGAPTMPYPLPQPIPAATTATALWDLPNQPHKSPMRTKHKHVDKLPPDIIATSKGKHKAELPKAPKAQKVDRSMKHCRVVESSESKEDLDQLHSEEYDQHDMQGSDKERKPCWGNHIGELPTSLQGPCTICAQKITWLCQCHTLSQHHCL
jgi:hypothetical protein